MGACLIEVSEVNARRMGGQQAEIVQSSESEDGWTMRLKPLGVDAGDRHLPGRQAPRE